MKKTAITLALVLTAGAVGFTYAGFYNPMALGSVVPVPANAYLTCYTVDNNFLLASANTTRRDILATFTQRDGLDSKVCFLRAELVNGGEWADLPQVLDTPTAPPPPVADSCTHIPNFVPGRFGGCVPADHPSAVR